MTTNSSPRSPSDEPQDSPRPRRPRASIRGSLSGLLVTLGLLTWIAVDTQPKPKAPAPPILYVTPQPSKSPVIKPVAAPVAVPVVPPKPVPPPKIEPDRVAIARAEESLDAATRQRAELEARLADAGLALRKASLEAAADGAASRTLAFQVKDPTVRIERATNQTAKLRWEIKKIQGELAMLDKPRPKARALMDKSAVAKPIDGKEIHFEVRRDRIAHMDIDKLTDMVKTDVKMRLRLNLQRGRSFTGNVGPVGDFTMSYEMGLQMPGSLGEVLDMRQSSIELKGWELVPEHDERGETLETIASPASVFSRVIGRSNPEAVTVTLWIYPDGYPLYRRIRDDLHSRGFLVAARPLPAGMSVRGSPSGSVSAGQ